MFKNLNKKGFTIVELVIVIAVIAILSAVLIPTFSNVIENARSTANLQEAKNELDSYVAFMAAKGQTLNDGVVFVVEDNDGTELAYYAYYKGGLHEFSKTQVSVNGTLVADSGISPLTYADLTGTNKSNYSVSINGNPTNCSHKVSYFTNSSLAENGKLYVNGENATGGYYAVVFAYQAVTLNAPAEGQTDGSITLGDKIDVQNDDGSLNVKIYAGRVVAFDAPVAD